MEARMTKDDAIGVLGLMTNLVDESGLAEMLSMWRLVQDKERTTAIVRERGERAMRMLGLVAIDPALVEAYAAIRSARAKSGRGVDGEWVAREGWEQEDPGGYVSNDSGGVILAQGEPVYPDEAAQIAAALNLADAVLAQLRGAR
jgi:hypothetical protein